MFLPVYRLCVYANVFSSKFCTFGVCLNGKPVFSCLHLNPVRLKKTIGEKVSDLSWLTKSSFSVLQAWFVLPRIGLENHIKLWKLRFEKLSFCYLNRNHVGTKRSKNEIKLYLSPRSNSCFSVSGSLIFLRKVQVESYILRKRVSIETNVVWCSIKNLTVQDVQIMWSFLNCPKTSNSCFF